MAGASLQLVSVLCAWKMSIFHNDILINYIKYNISKASPLCNKRLCSGAMSNHNDGGVKTKNIFIKNQYGNKTPLQIELNYINVAKFGEIFNAYAKRVGVERSDLRFLLDGELVSSEETFQSG